MAETTVEIQMEGKAVDKPGICHIIKEVIGFVLYMHQQIPHTLQQLEVEFASLKLEQQRMVAASTERETQLKPSSQRKMIGQSREIKRGIKKLEKLMTSISNLLSAMQTMVQKFLKFSWCFWHLEQVQRGLSICMRYVFLTRD